MGDELQSRHAPQLERGVDWRDKAACLKSDPELFFPVGITGPALEQTKMAKEVCARCLVQDECLGYALRTDQQSGISGNTTEDERRALKRRAHRQERERRAARAAIKRS
jgi:WhiB family redox-sensing transcriptional regulator